MVVAATEVGIMEYRTELKGLMMASFEKKRTYWETKVKIYKSVTKTTLPVVEKQFTNRYLGNKLQVMEKKYLGRIQGITRRDHINKKSNGLRRITYKTNELPSG